MRFVLKLSGGFVLMLIFSFLVLQLFFPDMSLSLETTIRQFFRSATGEKVSIVQNDSRPLLMIGFSQDGPSLEPTSLNSDVRARTSQIYEPLIRFDPYLRITPVLARSWGQINDTEWEFQIRKDVKFHSGRLLDADDVVASFRRAATYEKSDLKDFFHGITVTALNDHLLRATLEKPDPFFLSRITFLLIIPKEFADQASFSPTGSGPYRFISQKKGEEFSLKRFDEYYRRSPLYERVVYQIIPDRDKRLQAFTSGEIDLLVSLSPSHAKELESLNYKVLQRPSLETNFLVFHQDFIFQNPRLREAVLKALDRNDFVYFIEGFGKAASQFVPSGVFGFDPNISIPVPDLSSAKNLVKSVSKLELIPIKILLLKGFESVGNYLKEHLDRVGFNTSVEYADPDSFEKKVRGVDLYFYGWKSDTGASFDFLRSAVHSSGALNFGHYSNTQVDRLIDEVSRTGNEEHQLEFLQKIMQLIVEDDPYGVPLLEPFLLSSVSPDVHFSPRIDGQILLQEIE